MCSKVVRPSSLVVVYETLLSCTATIVDDEKGNPAWQARADFYITCILSCLPWGGSDLVEQIPEGIERELRDFFFNAIIRKNNGKHTCYILILALTRRSMFGVRIFRSVSRIC